MGTDAPPGDGPSEILDSYPMPLFLRGCFADAGHTDALRRRISANLRDHPGRPCLRLLGRSPLISRTFIFGKEFYITFLRQAAPI